MIMNVNYNIKQKISEALLNSKEYNLLLQHLAETLNKESALANSEETIACKIEDTLKQALCYYGIEYKPIREISLKEKSISGKYFNRRIDSKFNNIIFEYKKNILDKLEQYTEQTKNYITLAAAKEKQSLSKYVGILIDGRNCAFINYEGSSFIESSVLSINKNTLKEIISLIISIDKKELSSTNLLNDFAIQSPNNITKELLNALYGCLEDPSERTFMLYTEWERLFKLASNNEENNTNAIKARNNAIQNCFSYSNRINYQYGLFALHTAYTIIIKLIAYYKVAEIFFGASSLKIKDLLLLDKDGLKTRLSYIENGEIFKQIGLNNLLEGDFFSWYVYDNAWNEKIFNAIKKVISILTEYSGNEYLFSSYNIHDLFIDLYQSIIPSEVRHSLGEYYTPSWLARHVIEHINKPKNWSGLDPCAGSGTFILQMIDFIKKTEKDVSLRDILKRVKAVDVNPLAILTCRVNYFIAISSFIDSDFHEKIEIPVYLGDSAFIPQIIKENDIQLVRHTIYTSKGDLNFTLPVSLIKNKANITDKIVDIENAVIAQDEDAIVSVIESILMPKEKNESILRHIRNFANSLIILEKQNWDRIWTRIITGFLKIATFDKFDFIAGNPPWVDWKYLPEKYKETLKKICIDKHLFSGDNFTGGINLNICALITNVVANNWLKENGILAFLMPKSMLFQQSYTGFRNLCQTDNIPLNFYKLYDWSQAGKPFDPVSEKFMSYYLLKAKNKQQITAIKMKLKPRTSINKDTYNLSYQDALSRLDEIPIYCFQNKTKCNNFTFSENAADIPLLKKVPGRCHYQGRVGLGLYPKELLLFSIINKVNDNVLVENYQNKKSEKKVAKVNTLIEQKYLHPVIEGPNIIKFGLTNIKYFAPFPYSKQNRKEPISKETLQRNSPLLLSYYEANKSYFKKTTYNDKVQGKKGEFYSLTRVGDYTFGEYKVIFRNNTKWHSCVVSQIETCIGNKIPLLLDHACSISQDTNGSFITKDEAHYICAILNSTLITSYINGSSDARSYKTDLPIRLDKYDENNTLHKRLSVLSQVAHKKVQENKDISFIEKCISKIILKIYLK